MPPSSGDVRRPLEAAQQQGMSDGGTGAAYGSTEGGSSSRAPALRSSKTSSWLWKTASWLETSDDTDPALLVTWCCECEDEFKPRRIKSPVILVWLVLQGIGALFQWRMLMEIWGHLTDYEAALGQFCSPEHQRDGVCLGPAWNLSYSSALDFPASGIDDQSEFDYVIAADRTLTFDTQSQPATFLVGVEPLSPHTAAHWKLALSRQGSAPLPLIYGTGKKYQVTVSNQASITPGAAHWSGSMTLLSKFSTPAQVHVYVVDSRIQHLEEIHKQPQCSFEKSWQNFNERESGHHHQVLFFAWRATSFFFLFSFVTMGVMLRRFFYFVEGGKLLSRLIVLKFFVQDFPQQLCIVGYFYAWYAGNGLRCQMCLFHPEHCDDEHPLHFSNFLLCICTLLSACGNQLLLQVKAKRHYDEEEEFFQFMLRFSLLSLSTLPFSTAMLLLSAPLLQLRSVGVYVIFGVPCMIGWGTLLCLPMAFGCDDL